MTTKKDLYKMSFEELIKWNKSVDWETALIEEWNTYERRCKELAPKYFLQMDISALEKFYRENSSDDIEPWFDAWAKSLKDCYPFSEIFEMIETIETTLKVLLKENENTPANITIGQLNRLKGGL